MEPEHYEALTFADLQPGDMFIGLPTPGDNKRHSGFLRTHRIFIKDSSEVFRLTDKPDAPLYGSVTSLDGKLKDSIELTESVIRVN